MGRGGRAGAPRDPPCQRSMGKGAQGSSAKVQPRPPLPQLEPSWSPPPTRRHRGQGKPPGPGATLPCAPGQGGVTPPHSPPSRLFIAVLGRGCCLRRPARGQPLCPACRQGVNAFHQPTPFASAGAPQLGERGIEKGRRGPGLGLCPQHRVAQVGLIWGHRASSDYLGSFTRLQHLHSPH